MKLFHSRSDVRLGALVALLPLITPAALAAADERPIVANFGASRACAVTRTWSALAQTSDLSSEAKAFDGSNWYVEGAGVVQISAEWTFSTSLTGYTTQWKTYSSAPTSLQGEGPSAATQTLATGSTLSLASVYKTLLAGPSSHGLIYIDFKPITYKLKYVLNGGSSELENPTSATYGEPFTVYAPTRTGYTFAGWSVDGKTYAAKEGEAVTIKANLKSKQDDEAILTALWTVKKYPLTLTVNAGVACIHYKTSAAAAWSETTGSVVVEVENGAFYSCYADGAYGYALTGAGSSSANPQTAAMTPAGATFSPTASAKSYTIEVLSGEGGTARLVTGTGSYPYLSSVTVEASPNTGYVFAFWSDGNTERTRTIEVIANRTLTAHFKKNGELPVETHITFHSNYPTEEPPEIAVQTVEQNVPTALRRNTWSVTGYTFLGWASDMMATKPEYPDLALVPTSSEKDLYAVWQANTYEVLFEPNGGMPNQSITNNLNYGTAAEIPANLFVYANYQFAGWRNDATGKEYLLEEGQSTVTLKDLTALDGDHIRLSAIWALAEDCGEYSRALGCLNLKWQPGAEQFWNADAENHVVTYTGNGQNTLYSSIDTGENGCALQFDWNPVNDAGSVSVWISEECIPVSVRTNEGWVTYTYDISKKTAGNLSITPSGACSLRNVRWTRVPETKTVTFDLGGANAGKLQWADGSTGTKTDTVEVGHAALAPTVVGINGYAFDGWNTDFSKVEGDLTVTAKPATQVAYRIIYEKLRDGAVNTNPKTFTCEDAITFTALPGVGNFKGWSPTGIARGTTGDQVVTALWDDSEPETATYTVTVKDSWTTVTESVIDGNSIVLRTPKTKTVGGRSFTCTGWTGTGSIDSGTVDDTTPVDGSGNYVREYKITEPSSLVWKYDGAPEPEPTGETHEVEFVLGDYLTRTGGGALIQTVKDGAAATAPTVKAASGYEFKGWDTTFAVVKSDLTVNAHVAKIGATTFDVRVSVDAACEHMGTVSGAKSNVKPGKKVTVTAKAKTGYVFVGWFAGATSVSTKTSYSFTMPSEDVALVAKFLSKGKEASSIRVKIAGIDLFEGREDDAPLALNPSTNITVGTYLEWPLVATAEVAISVKVSGLPTGLKFTAKEIYNKTTASWVPANTIYGTPTAGGRTSTVKVLVTTAGKNKLTGTLKVTVAPLPTWLVGTYLGGAADAATAGSASVTLAKTGKISGRWISEGRTWTLTAAGFTSPSVATVTAKSGKLVETLTLVFAENDLGYGTVVAYTEDGAVLFAATYVPWKTDAALKLLARTLRGQKFAWEEGEDVSLTGTVGANGVVSVKGRFADVRTYSATSSATLIPIDETGERFSLFVYYPPKTNKFAGYAKRLVLAWDGEELEVVE